MEILYKDKTFFTSKDLALSVIGGRWKIAIIWCLLQAVSIKVKRNTKIPSRCQSTDVN